MTLPINSVITIEDNKKYVVLKSIDYQEKEYYFTMRLDENKKTIPSDIQFVFVEEENNDIYINIVDDENIIENLVKII